MDILITKDIQNSWIFQDSVKLKWWLDLVLMADENGEIHMSLSDLCHRWKAPKTTVHRFIAKLISGTVNGTKAEQQTERIIIHVSESYKGVRNGKWNESGTISGTPQESPLISLSPTPPISFNPKENYNTTTAPAYVHTREDEFVRRYKDEGLWMDVALILHVKSLEKCQILFSEFVTESQHNNTPHKDYNDFKRHFIQWARVALKKEIENGNNNGQDKRRGVQVVANSPEDYQGPF